MKGKPTRGRRRSQMLYDMMMVMMMVAMLHSTGQLRTQRDGDTEKGCQKPAVQQKTTEVKFRCDADVTTSMCQLAHAPESACTSVCVCLCVSVCVCKVNLLVLLVMQAAE